MRYRRGFRTVVVCEIGKMRLLVVVRDAALDAAITEGLRQAANGETVGADEVLAKICICRRG